MVLVHVYLCSCRLLQEAWWAKTWKMASGSDNRSTRSRGGEVKEIVHLAWVSHRREKKKDNTCPKNELAGVSCAVHDLTAWPHETRGSSDGEMIPTQYNTNTILYIPQDSLLSNIMLVSITLSAFPRRKHVREIPKKRNTSKKRKPIQPQNNTSTRHQGHDTIRHDTTRHTTRIRHTTRNKTKTRPKTKSQVPRNCQIDSVNFKFVCSCVSI